jgi:hypothetical protein
MKPRPVCEGTGMTKLLPQCACMHRAARARVGAGCGIISVFCVRVSVRDAVVSPFFSSGYIYGGTREPYH